MNLFRKIALLGLVSIGVAATAVAQIPNFRTLSGSGGRLDSTGVLSQLNLPHLSALSGDSQYIYFADQGKNTIRRVHIPSSRVTTLLGNGYNNNGITSGQALSVFLNFPTSVAHVGDSILYVTSFGQTACNFCGGGITSLNLKTGVARVLSLGSFSGQAITGMSVLGGATADTLFYSGAYGANSGLTKLIINKATGALISGLNLVPTSPTVPNGLGSTPGGTLVMGDSILVVDRANGRIVISSKNNSAYREFVNGLNQPYGISKATDTSIYVTDINNNRLILINLKTGGISTLANGLGRPRGVVSNDTAIFVIEETANRIRYALKSSPGTFKNFSGRQNTVINGDAKISTFEAPNDVAFGQGRALYVADRGNSLLRVVNADTGSSRTLISAPAITDIVFKDSVLYYNQSSRNAIYRVTSYNLRTGRTAILGGASGFSGPAGNQVDGDSATSRFKYPTGLAIDESGRNLYVGSVGANNEEGFSIRRVNIATKTTTTIVGSVTPTSGYVDGIGNAARVGAVSDVAVSGDTILYFADASNDRIRKVDLRTMAVTTVAGTGTNVRTPRDAANGLSAAIADIGKLALDTVNGYLYFTDGNLLRRVTLSGTFEVKTVSGTNSPGYRDGLALRTLFSNPSGIVFDSTAKTLYLADTDNGRIRAANFIINTAPSFAKGPDTSALENAPLQVIRGWATNIVPGSLSVESSQIVRYSLRNDNPTLFTVQPTVDSTGTLRFRPATNRFGFATVSIIARDNGGIDGGGIDSSARTTFVIRIDSVNSAPVYTTTVANGTITTNTGVAAVTVNNWATAIAASNAPNFEGWQTTAFSFRTKNPQLYTTLPNVTITGAAGVLNFVPSRVNAGRDTLDVILRDNGGVANGGVDSVKGRLIVIINQYVNIRPAFTISAANASLTYPAIIGGPATTINNWLTALSAGPIAEAWQTLNVTVRTLTPAMYTVAPSAAIVTVGTARNANLGFTLSGQPGVDTLYVVLKDNGGNAFGGADSILRKAVVRVNVNAAPAFTVSAANLALSYPNNSTQAVSLNSWGTAVGPGAAIEAPQTLNFTITSRRPSLYSVQPALAILGTTARTAGLTFTLAGVDGMDTLTVVLKDNGGTLGGGVDTLVRTFTVRVGLVGLQDKIAASEVRIYPNPTSSVLNIDLTGMRSSAPVSATLTNLAGQQIWNGELNTQAQNQLSVDGQPAGLYLLHLVQDGKHLVQKIRKQ